MHIEFLVEDASGAKLIEIVIPKIIGAQGEPHTWRIKPYKGVGRLPPGLKPRTDASKRILLDHLPRLIAGYCRTNGIDRVVVVVDSDRRDCVEFLAALQAVSAERTATEKVMFRLAIEEIEAWYFGDRPALLEAYSKAKSTVLGQYVQDSVCGTWEMLADALHPGGSSALKKAGFGATGEAKHAWAVAIGPAMDPDRNLSPSFQKFRDGLRRIIDATPPSEPSPRHNPSNSAVDR